MSDDQLAHMAYVVGVTPDQLDDSGEAEAAEILREIERQERQAADTEQAGLPEIPSYVVREDVEDWEWEIWEKVTLLGPSDKALMIEFLKGVYRRARATEGSDLESRNRQQTG